MAGEDVSGRPGLTRVVARGVGWSYVGVVSGFALQLAYTAVMSRLLEPREFGLVAGALLGLRFVVYLSRFGLGSAVVQRPVLSARESGSAMTLSLLVGLGAAGLAVALSGVLAAAISQPAVGDVMRWMALTVLLGAWTAVPEALLRRAMRFRALTVTQVVSTAAGFLGVGVPLAIRGWGAWSLVAASIAQVALQLLLVCWLARTGLRPVWDLAVMRGLLSFGGVVAFTGFLEFVGSNVDTFAVGRFLGPASLGQYSRSTYLVGLPIEQATTATSRVLLPSFASIQSEPDRFRRGVLGGLSLLSLVIAVPVALASACAPAVVDLVLGDGWGPAASVLPLVAFAYGLSMMTHIPAVAAEALGYVQRKLLIQLTVLGVFIALVAVVAAGPRTLLWFGAAWIAAETLRLVLYILAIVPALGVTRAEAMVRYSTAWVVAGASSVPGLVMVRWGGSSGFVPLALSGIAGLACALVAMLLPLSSTVRREVRALFVGLRG